MIVLVINSGSSSLKCKLFDMSKNVLLKSFLVEHIAEDKGKFKNHHDALLSLDIDFSNIDIVGHRVVHGGEFFSKSVVIDDEVIKKIDSLSSLAPLHNPANLEGIYVTKKILPNVLQVAVFDTAFHSTMPQEAFRYALNNKLYSKYHIRKYGFHGTSHSYLVKEASKILKKDIDKINLITLHLGNGASITAIKNGKSIDTSMGFTPLEGLVMGSRCGDIDPAIVLYLQRELGFSVNDVDTELNKHSGLLGLAGNNDVRELLSRDDDEAVLALKIMIRRVQKYIGAYMAILEDIDAIVFSGGIGENSDYIRTQIMSLKLFKNIKTLVIKTDEELEIARECVDKI